MQTAIRAVDYHLPERVLTNADLAAEFPEWPPDKILAKTGIGERHLAAAGECSSDLAARAAQKLFDSGACHPRDIDFLLLCTQTPDHFLPTTACLVQDRLGIPKTAGALDINLGCSGYVYGLSLAQGLIATGQASRLLLLTADTYSKFIHPQDKSVRTLFGDGASATLLEAVPDSGGRTATSIFGTDGRGARNLIVPAGGLRQPRSAETSEVHSDDDGNRRSLDNLYMDGAEIFTFTVQTVPDCVHRLLARAGKEAADIDLFLFHQANQYMLEHLRKKLRIPPERFFTWLKPCGNTTSSSIPIALKHALAEGRLLPGHLVMMVGFGVGYSWAATLLEWPYLGVRP